MPENRRILYFSSQFPTLHSPSRGVFSLQRVRALRRAGCDVLVVNPVDMTAILTRPGQAYRWMRNQAQHPCEMMLQGMPVYYPRWIYPPKRIIGWYSSYFLYFQVQNLVKKLAKSFLPDAILASWLPDAVAASLLGNTLHIPVLAIADGTDVNAMPDKYRAWNYARDILNEKADFLVFVSDALKSVGNSRGLSGRKSIVLHNAVDIHLFTPSSLVRNDGVFTILGVGRLIHAKGFQILLDAFAAFHRRLSEPARLILVGEGPQRNSLVQQAVDLGIRSSVEFVDPLEQEELVKYYQAANVFCLPSYSEGLPCVVVEAMACGKPVVASRVGGTPEVVDAQSGILVAPGDASALCEALLQAKNSVWNGEIIRKKIVDDFGWEKWAKTMIELFDNAS